jgi:hypothetical protein
VPTHTVAPQTGSGHDRGGRRGRRASTSAPALPAGPGACAILDMYSSSSWVSAQVSSPSVTSSIAVRPLARSDSRPSDVSSNSSCSHAHRPCVRCDRVRDILEDRVAEPSALPDVTDARGLLSDLYIHPCRIHPRSRRSARALSSAFSRVSAAISRRAAASFCVEPASATPSWAARAADAKPSSSTASCAVEPEMGSRSPRTREASGRITTRPFTCPSLNVSTRRQAPRVRP